MTLSSAFYGALNATGGGINAALNWVSGETALKDKHLERPEYGAAPVVETLIGAGLIAELFAVVVGTFVNPAFPLIATALKLIGGAVVADLACMRLQAAYVVGKAEQEKPLKVKKLPKASNNESASPFSQAKIKSGFDAASNKQTSRNDNETAGTEAFIERCAQSGCGMSPF